MFTKFIYHVVSDLRPSDDLPFSSLALSPEAVRTAMQTLRSLGVD